MFITAISPQNQYVRSIQQNNKINFKGQKSNEFDFLFNRAQIQLEESKIVANDALKIKNYAQNCIKSANGIKKVADNKLFEYRKIVDDELHKDNFEEYIFEPIEDKLGLKMTVQDDGNIKSTFTDEMDDFNTNNVLWEYKEDGTKTFYNFINGKLTKYATGIKQLKNGAMEIKKEYYFSNGALAEYTENIVEKPNGEIICARDFIFNPKSKKLQSYQVGVTKPMEGKSHSLKAYDFDARTGEFNQYLENLEFTNYNLYKADKILNYYHNKIFMYGLKIDWKPDGSSTFDEYFMYNQDKIYEYMKDGCQKTDGKIVSNKHFVDKGHGFHSIID